MPKLIGSNPSSIKQNKCEISRFEIKKDNPFYWYYWASLFVL